MPDFNYTMSQGQQQSYIANTSLEPDMRASNAFKSIQQLASTTGQFLKEQKEIKDKAAFNEEYKNFLDYQADFAQKWQETDVNGRGELISELEKRNSEFSFDPNNEYSLRLQTALSSHKQRYDEAFTKETIALSDNYHTNDILNIAAKAVNPDLTINKDAFQIAKETMPLISDYSVNSGKYNQALDNTIMYALMSQAKNLAPTEANLAAFNNSIADFVKMSPKAKGTDTYNSLSSTAKMFGELVKNKALQDNTANLHNDRVSQKEFETEVTNLVSKGYLSDAQADYLTFSKGNNMQTKSVKTDIATAYHTSDYKTLG